MKEVIRVSDPRIVALLQRQATQYSGDDQLGLDRIRALLDRLGQPQHRLSPTFHVAGTNGKGSTCAFLRAALEAAGHKVHMFTSPHLVRYNERIRLAGTLIDDDRLAEVMGRVLDANDSIGASLFEINTAAAFLAFTEVAADACIIEVGLGGRCDATNIVETPLVCGIASLGLDHQSFLGSSMTQIAAEKAGIAKRGVPLVTQAYPPGIAARIGEVAEQAGAIRLQRGRDWHASVRGDRIAYADAQGELSLPLPQLPGRHQALNAALAVAMLRHQSALAVGSADYEAAMGWADWPARLQQLGQGPLHALLPAGSELWVDGGHNPSAAKLVADHARRSWSDGLPLLLLFASLVSKDAAAVLAPFAGAVGEVRTLPIDGHDCRDPDALAEMARGQGFTATAHGSLQQALSGIDRAARVLIFGSLYLAGEALAANGQLPD